MDTTRIDRIIAQSDLARLLPEKAKALTRPQPPQTKDTRNAPRPQAE